MDTKCGVYNIETGLVSNVVVIDNEITDKKLMFVPGPGLAIIADETVEIGDNIVDGAVVKPD